MRFQTDPLPNGGTPVMSNASSKRKAGRDEQYKNTWSRGF